MCDMKMVFYKLSARKKIAINKINPIKNKNLFMIRRIILASLILISFSNFGQTINEIGYYDANSLMGITCKDEYMILSNGEIVDNTIPSSPTKIGHFAFWGDGFSIITSGDYAYFGLGMTNALLITDISNVTSPVENGSIYFTIGSGVFGMDISENTLFVALGYDGILCSIDVSDKNNPVLLDTLYLTGGQTRDVVLQDNYAFVANGLGLYIIDISDASNLQLMTSIGSGYNSIDIGDNLVFMGKSSGGVDVYDISEPLNPTPTFSIANSSGTVWDLQYHKKHLYLATNNNGLFMYQIEENSGTEVANFPNTGNGQSFGVCVQDSLILLTGQRNGVAILQYDSTGTVGINEINSKTHLNIFPNPAKDYISIENNTSPIYNINIFNISGNLVKQINQDWPIRKIKISDLFNGQYFIHAITDDKVLIQKFIKIQ